MQSIPQITIVFKTRDAMRASPDIAAKNEGKQKKYNCS
jgi:hypothetical protein